MPKTLQTPALRGTTQLNGSGVFGFAIFAVTLVSRSDPARPPGPAAAAERKYGISAIDRSDGSAVQATGGSVSGATATQP